MDARLDTNGENEGVCSYLLEDKAFAHVFHFGGKVLYCDRLNCPYGNKTGKFFYEGEGEPFGICKTNGLIGIVEQTAEQVKDIPIPA